MAKKETNKGKVPTMKNPPSPSAKKGRDEKGKFVVGNQISIGNDGGAPLKFPTPEDLENACRDYFEWADTTPWYKNDVVRGGEMAGTPLQIPAQRPYTLIALCQHIGIAKSCFKDYHNRAEYLDLCTRVRDKIDNQQIEGALIGVFNASLTARIQGLADKKQHEGGNPDKPIHTEMVTKVVFEGYPKQENSIG